MSTSLPNASHGNSSGDPPPDEAAEELPTDLKIGLTVAYSTIFILGLLGNSIGFYIVCKKSPSRSVANTLIANLCLADLLVTLTVVPISIVHMYIGSLWFDGVFGHVSCTLYMFSYTVTIAASIITILIVSIDRFYAIFYPLRGRLFRKPKVMSGIIWVSSVVCMSPYLLLWRTEKGPHGHSYCAEVWYWEHDFENYTQTIYINKIYSAVLFALLYIIPLLIITILYVMIAVRLWVRRIPGNATDSNREAQERSKRKVIKLLSILVIIFALFWLPTHVMHYYYYVEPDKFSKISPEARHVLFWLTHAQSSINPFVYILLNGSFRKEFVKIFKVFSFFERQTSRLSGGSRRDSRSSSISFVRSMRSIVSLGRSTEYDLPRNNRSVSCSSVVSRASLKKITPNKDTPL